ncbi:MAG: YoaK family protein, partial [Acidimicrobiales bacterium]
MTALTDLWRTLVPPHGDRHGPLAPLLVALTVVTGLVDAFSYLVLGHVFVANMTGNVVFLAFALTGAKGFSIAASLAALVAFFVGALCSGRLVARVGPRRGRMLAVSTTFQASLVAVALVVGLSVTDLGTGASRYVLIGLMGLAMGMQNGTARKLAVPDLT